MNIGFVVNNLGNSEVIFELLQAIPKASLKSNNIVPYIFHENFIPPVGQPPCLSMNITGISNFTGKVFAIGLESAQIMYKNNSRTDNYVLLWDIPWLESVINYGICLDILRNFKIVVRSENHRNIVKNYTGRNDIILINTMEEIFDV